MVIATQSIASLQQPLFDDCLLEQALLGMSQAKACERGAVFTRQEVTEFILDLCGYDVPPSSVALGFRVRA